VDERGAIAGKGASHLIARQDNAIGRETSFPSSSCIKKMETLRDRRRKGKRRRSGASRGPLLNGPQEFSRERGKDEKKGKYL